MTWYDEDEEDVKPNVYYYPEKLGLTIVASLEFSNASYCFDTRVVWKDKERKYYTARDSGCSCPTPFEDYNSVESLAEYNHQEIEKEIEEYIKEQRENKEEWDYEWGNPNFETESGHFLDNIRQDMRGI